MDTQRKQRGRPLGSSRYKEQDPATLGKVADLMVITPSLTKTAAIKQVGVRDPAGIRRLQDKFKRQEEKLMMAAQQRRREREKSEPLQMEAMILENTVVSPSWQSLANGREMPQMTDWARMMDPFYGLDPAIRQQAIAHQQQAIRIMEANRLTPEMQSAIARAADAARALPNSEVVKAALEAAARWNSNPIERRVIEAIQDAANPRRR